MRTTPLLTTLVLCVGAAAALAQPGGAAPPQRPPPPTHPPPPRGPRTPDAVAVLQAAAEAVKDGYAATVKSYFEGTASLAGMFPKSEGRWAQLPLHEEGKWAVRYAGFGTLMTQKDPIDFDILWLPDRIAWLDHDTETFNVQPHGGRKTGAAFQLASGPWGQAEPLATGFAAALASAAAIEIRDPAEIDGLACDVVAITQKAGSDPTIWYFGRADHLPRRCELVLPENPQMSGAFRVDFVDGAAGGSAVQDSDWTITAPDGYNESISNQFRESPEETARQVLTTPDSADPASVGAGRPDWEVPDSEGVLVSPGSLRGKVSVLYFWGTWSPACKKATPEVQALVQAYAGQPVEVISMAFREADADSVVAAARSQGQTWRQVPAADEAATILSVRLAPAIVVLGKGGELLYKSGRPGNDYTEMFSKVRAIVDQALTAEAPAEDSHERTPGSAQGAAPDSATPALGRPKRIDDDR